MSNSEETKVLKRIRPPHDTDADDRAHLEKYCRVAIESGAADAKIIKSDQVIIEHRVTAKCQIPTCEYYGTARNCPPYAPSPEEMKLIVGEYKYAIFLRLILPSDEMAYGKALDFKKATVSPLKIFEVVSKVESEAYYDGYYLAMGFGGGGCRRVFCHDAECAALTGKGCRHGIKSRPSMEAVGMNVFQMATAVGWDIYPIGKRTHPDEVPHGNRLGLVLIF